MSGVQASAQFAAMKEMATKGDAAAQYDMGARYAEGRGVTRDASAAIGWFEKAAAQGQARRNIASAPSTKKARGSRATL